MEVLIHASFEAVVTYCYPTNSQEPQALGTPQAP